VDWEERLEAATRAHEERCVAARETKEAREEAEPADRPDLALASVASASWAAGLALLMLGRRDEAASTLRRAAEEYATSEAAAPAGSWGRPLAALRCRLLAADMEGAATDARRLLAAGAATDSSPIARYAATLARLTLGEDAAASGLAKGLQGQDDFPAPVADALGALSRGDRLGYERAVGLVLDSFEQRDAFLEDVPVADTVLVLQQLAGERGLEAQLASPLVPRPV
jgi:hypothetical protein